MSSDLHIRRLEAADLPQWIELLRISKMAIAGLSGRTRVYSCLGRMALGDPDVVVMVGVQGSSVVTSAGVIVDPKQFWPRFVRCYPLLLVERALGRARRMFRRRKSPPEPLTREAVEQYITPASGRTWGESGRHIGVAVFGVTHPGNRGGSLGRRVLAAAIDESARLGVTRVDARIGARNIASVRMSHGIGFRIEQEEGGGFFLTMDLPRPGSA